MMIHQTIFIECPECDANIELSKEYILFVQQKEHEEPGRVDIGMVQCEACGQFFSIRGQIDKLAEQVQSLHIAQMTGLFGPLATHSQYHVGQVVRYRGSGHIKQGKIVWVCAPGRIVAPGHAPHRIQYVIDDGITIVDAADIVEIVQS